MKTTNRTLIWIVICLASTTLGLAQDWPQWRGPNRDAKAASFKSPASWPGELTRKWKVAVEDGVATPALVGDKLYVFTREQGSEILRCLNAADGQEIWQNKYEALGASGAASSYSGPRSSPTVAEGKVVTVGVRGMLSCVDAATGQLAWRKDEFRAYPRFHPSSSPIIMDGLCIAQLGGNENGAVVAYDLAGGQEKWRWNGPAPAYASPVLLTLDGRKLVVAQTESKLVALDATNGKLVWEEAGAADSSEQRGRRGGGRGRGGGGGRDYKAATPIVDGQTIITAGQGLKAIKLEKEGDGYTAKELWQNSDRSVLFNTPVLRDGVLYGLTPNNEFFCVNAENGQTLWSAPVPGGDDAAESGGRGERGGRGGRGGRGRGGYGSIVDAGSVLLALTPASQLLVLEPSRKEFKQLASYKIADTPTHAHPVPSENRIFIKDADSVILWTVE